MEKTRILGSNKLHFPVMLWFRVNIAHWSVFSHFNILQSFKLCAVKIVLAINLDRNKGLYISYSEIILQDEVDKIFLPTHLMNDAF